ncbi:pesticidal crystal protein [Bacillus toyonensis]|uniref:insecticidal delta-endotoxin Cry8Ea1 family protein n=1 Tax=Bacillus toyonensis TaxID=155322 RepID=UPI000902E629|nr:insecticidal delta-endotoxin Cry8Ea1 family protein [Bacillus toyonensis]PHD59073.1 pesticidal crystal protein [Bacillus toyonensis]
MNSYKNENEYEYEILDTSQNNSNMSNRYPRYPLANNPQTPMRNVNYKEWLNMCDSNTKFVGDINTYSSPKAALSVQNAIVTGISISGTVFLVIGSPVLGQSLLLISRLINLLWSVFRPLEPWEELMALVEELINQRIEVVIKNNALASLDGLQQIMELYRIRLSAWVNNKNDQTKMAVREQHRIVDNFLEVNMARFRISGSEVLLLPVYAQAANLHLILLRDIDLFGAEWGIGPEQIRDDYIRLQRYIREYKDHCVIFYNQGLNQFNRSTAQEWIRFNRFRREMTLTVLDLASFFPNYDPRIYPTAVKTELTREIYTDLIGNSTFSPWWNQTVTSFSTIESSVIRRPSFTTWLNRIRVFTGSLNPRISPAYVWGGHELVENRSNGSEITHVFGNTASLTPIQFLSFANVSVFRINSLARSDTQAHTNYGVSRAIFHTSDINNAPGSVAYEVPNNNSSSPMVSELPRENEQRPNEREFSHRLSYISHVRARRYNSGTNGNIDLLMYGWTHTSMNRNNRLEPDGITQIDAVKGVGGTVSGVVIPGPTGGNLVNPGASPAIFSLRVQAPQIPTSYRIRLRYACLSRSPSRIWVHHSGNFHFVELPCNNVSGRPSNTLLESDFHYVDVPGVFSPSINPEILFQDHSFGTVLDKIEFIPIPLLPEGFRIVTALNNNFVIDLNPNNNVTMWNNNGGDNQRWRFTYDQQRNAYVIRNLRNPDLALTWDTTSSSVVAAKISPERREQYWVLENFQNGYVLLNLRDTGRVLDVAGGSVGSGTNLIVYPRHNGNGQIFFIRKP